MTPEEIRTLALFNSLESKPEMHQRQLAQELGVSLGLTNTYLQRVLKKGWIRAKQVKPRRWLYFLTPKGAIEKSRLSISYLNRTLESFRELKRKGDEHLSTLYRKGVRGVHLCGDKDLIEIISFCFSGYEMELLSVISENYLLEQFEKKQKISFPNLHSSEMILITSLVNSQIITKLLNKQGFKKNKQWVLFS